jgi:hypothetical protein
MEQKNFSIAVIAVIVIEVFRWAPMETSPESEIAPGVSHGPVVSPTELKSHAGVSRPDSSILRGGVPGVLPVRISCPGAPRVQWR